MHFVNVCYKFLLYINFYHYLLSKLIDEGIILEYSP